MASSNFLYTPLKEFMFELELEQAENFSEYELWNALVVCMQQGWIYDDDEGVLLTAEGQQLKDEVGIVFHSNVYRIAEVDGD